jgi:peroxiredoxin
VKRLLLFAVFALLLAGTGCFSGSKPPHVGLAAKEFTVQDSDRTVTLNQFHGKIVVLNFWATWCPPCVEELPSLMTLQERLRSQGVVVVGISIDEDNGKYHRFLQERGINFLTVRDPAQRVSSMYQTTGWPETYIIDRQGVVRRKFVGAVDWSAPEVVEFLTRL